MDINFKDWARAASIRAVKTIAQTAMGMIAVGAAMDEVNWLYVGSVSLTAGILSLLTSIAGLPEVELEKDKQLLKDVLKEVTGEEVQR
jgi:hypothetical protein